MFCSMRRQAGDERRHNIGPTDLQEDAEAARKCIASGARTLVPKGCGRTAKPSVLASSRLTLVAATRSSSVQSVR